MGEASETTMQQQKKKKKGRPSLLDLQKRSLKQQQQQEDPNSFNLISIPTRRSIRRNPFPDLPECFSGEDDERKEKKHKLLNGLDPHPYYPTLSPNSSTFDLNPDGSYSNANIEDTEAALKRRKISVFNHGSDAVDEKVSKETDSLHGSQVDSGPTTPLPDKKLLVFILDRLQKKDTHGVFSEPVDPEQLPDYHDIIENPMDFETVRKKVDGGAYANLEQFEARSMQELAKKDFENLRQDSDNDEPQPKVVQRGRPPGKNLRKSPGSSPSEHVCPGPALDATLVSGGGNARGSGAYNLGKGLTPPAQLVRTSHWPKNSETCTSWWSEWENEFPASVLKYVLKYGKKQFALDENRRDTYKHALDSCRGPSVWAALDGELKQLVEVSLHLEHGYARSLAQFAADLGPVVWKVASKKIDRFLPRGLEFGPGWTGENEVLMQEQSLFTEVRSFESSIPDDCKSKLLYHRISESNTAYTNGFLLQGQEDLERTGLDS
ncbi:hypothetical protein F2P56_018260 [Juglans regia]|uniref:Bromo domain-containing protein n=1 Tax=Juglans regia TaxID=51240 RepID=A0A833X759_JUGRE|nr:hypothetical protein F2P56_018260 [Juglans regia]